MSGSAKIEKRRIDVVNTEFSTLSTSFSTACFHRAMHTGLCREVNIIRFDRLQLFCHFCLCGNSADGVEMTDKKGLDSGKICLLGRCDGAGKGKKRTLAGKNL